MLHRLTIVHLLTSYVATGVHLIVFSVTFSLQGEGRLFLKVSPGSETPG